MLAAVYDAGIGLRSLNINLPCCLGENLADGLAIREDGMLRFKDAASSIQNLSLVGYVGYRGDNTVETFLSSMGGLRTLSLKTTCIFDGESFIGLIKRTSFPHLTELRLEDCNGMTEDDLFSFVSRHGQTLRRLELVHVRLSGSLTFRWSTSLIVYGRLRFSWSTLMLGRFAKIRT